MKRRKGGKRNCAHAGGESSIAQGAHFLAGEERELTNRRQLNGNVDSPGDDRAADSHLSLMINYAYTPPICRHYAIRFTPDDARYIVGARRAKHVRNYCGDPHPR